MPLAPIEILPNLPTPFYRFDPLALRGKKVYTISRFRFLGL